MRGPERSGLLMRTHQRGCVAKAERNAMLKETAALGLVAAAMGTAAVLGQHRAKNSEAVPSTTPVVIEALRTPYVPANGIAHRPNGQQWLLCAEDDRIVIDLWAEDNLPEAYCEHVDQ